LGLRKHTGVQARVYLLRKRKLFLYFVQSNKIQKTNVHNLIVFKTQLASNNVI